jgi:adenine-specific DNA-methyltransferase
MQRFLNFIKHNKAAILRQYGDPLKFCLALIDQRDLVASGEKAELLLGATTGDARDYAISIAYALLIGHDRRKDLSAYFTPPTLAAAAAIAAKQFLIESKDATVLDPACGGGSFLVPIARLLVATDIDGGMTPQRACKRSLSRLRGIEIDPGLATLSERLLTLLRHSFCLTPF